MCVFSEPLFGFGSKRNKRENPHNFGSPQPYVDTYPYTVPCFAKGGRLLGKALVRGPLNITAKTPCNAQLERVSCSLAAQSIIEVKCRHEQNEPQCNKATPVDLIISDRKSGGLHDMSVFLLSPLIFRDVTESDGRMQLPQR